MSLKDFVIPSQRFEVSGGEIVVRGLGLDSVLFLLRTHGAPLQDLYARAVDGKLDVSKAESLVAEMLDESATLVGCIIACAAGEPDQFEKAAALPAPLQIEIIEAVCRMTFEMAGGLGKFMETVNRMLESLSQPASPPS